MKLELIEYTCSKCGIKFKAPGLPESSYGEFLLYSKHGSSAYLNAIEDPTYKEVDRLLSLEPKIKNLSPADRAKILRHVYGPAACDWDDVGFPFGIDIFPPCPNHHSNSILEWRFGSPPEWVDVRVPPVTHVVWKSLSEPEKIGRLRAELSRT